VQVLEDENRLPRLCPGLEAAAPRGEGLLLGGRLPAGADERSQACLQPGEVEIVSGKRPLELRLRLFRWVRFEDAALRLDDLAQGPVGDPLPVGKTTSLAPAHETWPVLDVAEELGAETALSNPRLAHDRHELAGALLRRAFEGADEERLLELTPHERGRVRAGHIGAEAGASGERAEERYRFRLALHLHRLELLVAKHPLRPPVGLLRDRDPVYRRCPLQARGGIDDVARDDALAMLGARAEGHHRLAGVDADADLQGERGVVLVELFDRLQDAEAGADGALGVVLVRHGCSEDRHDRVADELLHCASVALDLLP
jgi:hypothetical protein